MCCIIAPFSFARPSILFVLLKTETWWCFLVLRVLYSPLYGCENNKVVICMCVWKHMEALSPSKTKNRLVKIVISYRKPCVVATVHRKVLQGSRREDECLPRLPTQVSWIYCGYQVNLVKEHFTLFEPLRTTANGCFTVRRSLNDNVSDSDWSHPCTCVNYASWGC